MPSKRIGCCVLVALTTMAMPAQATTIFDDGVSHIIDTQFEDVKLYDSPQRKITNLHVDAGGDISELDGTSVSAFGSSMATIAGTLQGDLVLSDSAFGVIGFGFGEPSIRGNVEAKDGSVLEVRSGTISGNTRIKDSSKSSIQGGTLAGSLECQNECVTRVYGGTVRGAIRAQNQGEIYARAGTFEGAISAEGTATVSLHGHGFVINGVPVDYGPISVNEGTIEGTFVSGYALSTTFAISDGAQIILMPEPSTMLLAAIGLFGILLNQRRR